MDAVTARVQFEGHGSVGGWLRCERLDGSYLFDFKPEGRDREPSSSLEIESHSLLFVLHELKSVQIKKESKKKIYVKFMVNEVTTYSVFIFEDDSVPLFMDFFNGLISKNAVVQNARMKNEYLVTIQSDKKYKVNGNAMTLADAQSMHAHRRAKHRLEEMMKQKPIPAGKPLSLDMIRSKMTADGRMSDFPSIKEIVYLHGLEPDARAFYLPYLMGLYKPDMTDEQKQALLRDKLFEYKNLMKQWELRTPEQENVYSDYLQVIINDVRRTDRTTDLFSSDESPAAKSLTQLLICFVLYNKNVGFVQGMGDLLSPLMHILIGRYEGELVYLNDGQKLPVTEFESYLFWIFINMMDLGNHTQIFKDLAPNQALIAETACAIATHHHPMLGRWLLQRDMSGLLFLYPHFLLQYKRDFDIDVIQRMWECIYSSEQPAIFTRFITAAVLFELFPLISSKPSTNLGDLMVSTGSAIQTMNGEEILSLALFMYHNTVSNEQLKWVFITTPTLEKQKVFMPKYFKLCSNT